jgi:transmembrane sensor
MTQDNRIWILFSRHLSGEANSEEVEELQLLLQQSPGRQYSFDILRSYFTHSPAILSTRSADDPGLEKRFQKMIEQPAEGDLSVEETQRLEWPQPTEWPRHAPAEESRSPEEPRFVERRISFRKKWTFAAAAAACLLLGWGIHRLVSAAPSTLPIHHAHTEEVLARAGTRTKLLLPDGTQVWLNSNSKLDYAEDFNTASREVVLEGEAYFDVIKDKQRPFIVHASDLDIKVLGTAFTIKSYPQDATVEATLLRGAIEVSRKGHPNTPRVLLKPNEKLVFSKHLPTAQIGNTGSATDTRAAPKTPDISISPIAVNLPDSEKVETGWLYNRLVFNGDSFKDLAEKMERWYNVKIYFKDEGLYQYRFGGAFANETIQEALNALQLTTKFTYKINGNEIELYGK